MPNQCDYHYSSPDFTRSATRVGSKSGYETLRFGNTLIEQVESPSTVPDDWTCDRDVVNGSDYCEFHMSPTARSEAGITEEDLQSRIEAEIEQADTETDFVPFIGVHLTSLSLNGLINSGTAHTIEFADATIEGDLNLSSATIKNELSFREATISGQVKLNNVDCTQIVDFSWAIIENGVSLELSTFSNELLFDHTIIDGTFQCIRSKFSADLLCRHSIIYGSSIIIGRFNGDLSLDGTVCTANLQLSTDSGATDIEGSLDLSQMGVAETVELSGIAVTGTIDLEGIIVGQDLQGSGLQTDSSLSCDGVHILREIDLTDATVGEDFTFIQQTAEDSVSGFQLYSSYRPQGPYNMSDIVVDGRCVIEISELVGSPPMIHLRGASLGQGQLRQGSDIPILYDLQGAKLGDIDIENNQNNPAFELYNFVDVSFKGFNFRKHYEDLKTVDYQIDRAMEVYGEVFHRRRVLVKNQAIWGETSVGSQSVLSAIMAIPEFKSLVESPMSMEQLLDVLEGVDTDADLENAFAMLNDSYNQIAEVIGIAKRDLSRNKALTQSLASGAGRSALVGVLGKNYDRTQFAKLSTEAYPIHTHFITQLMRFLGILRYLSGIPQSDKVTFKMGDVVVEGTHSEESEFEAAVVDVAERVLCQPTANQANNTEHHLEKLFDGLPAEDWVMGLSSEELFRRRLGIATRSAIEGLPDQTLAQTASAQTISDAPEVEMFNTHSELLHVFLDHHDSIPGDPEYTREITYRKAKTAADTEGENKASREFFIKELKQRRKSYHEGISVSDSYLAAAIMISRYAGNFFLYILSGYGERSSYVITSSAIIIVFFAGIYRLFLPFVPYDMIGGSLVFSVESFVTLVHSGGVEVPARYRLLTQLEGFIGAFMIALFVVTLSRTVKR